MYIYENMCNLFLKYNKLSNEITKLYYYNYK